MTADAPSISPRALYDRLRGGEPASILDVRDRDEFENWHVDGPTVTARHVPYVQLVAARATGDPSTLVPDDLDEPLIAVCGVGEASGETATMLQDQGIDAVNLEGGMDAWSNLVLAHDVATGESLVDVRQYERPATGCLSYLVTAEENALLVDPLRTLVDTYMADIEAAGLALRYAVDTHVHADHLSGTRRLADQTDAAVVLPSGAMERGLEFDATLVSDGETLSIGDATIEIVSTPGHTTEHVALVTNSLLFTGDTLFLDGIGRPDLEDTEQARDQAAALYETLHETVFEYPDETLIMPGHIQPGDTDSDGPYVDSLSNVRERVGNTDMKQSDFVDHGTEDLPPRPANHEQIIAYNLGRKTIDQSALSLELGPNNCAIPGE